MNRAALFFTAQCRVEVRTEPLPDPGPGQVLVQTLLSAISPGTETLIYRGQFPAEMAVDASIPALAGKFEYPFKYGYSAVGRVIACGKDIPPGWEDKLVFAFNPHESHFLADIQALQPLPQRMTAETALFLPNMETALNFVMDAAPLIGEKTAIFGQGIVGLLTTALLARFPLARLVSLDRFPTRRQASLAMGASASLDPSQTDSLEQARLALAGEADLCLELSGQPAALDQAIALTGFAGRILIGSWYGQKRAALNLGDRFHRSRIRLISSQVSSLAPELSGRWTKGRRFEVAWEMLRQVRPEQFITQRFSLAQAAQAYALLDQAPEEAIQVVLTYDTDPNDKISSPG
jgi:2-desacetyl-2-hydroxyethyl bacteriochlorophyllide A dehydrogenase